MLTNCVTAFRIMYSIIRKGAVDEIEADIEFLRQRDNRCTD